MYAMNIQNDVIGLVLCENCKSKQITDIIAWPSRCYCRIYGIYFLQKQVPVFPRQAQLEEFLTFSVKDRLSIKLFYLYQILQWTENYFLKIKFVFFHYLLLWLYIHESRKEHDLSWYRTPVFTQLFSWCIHITIAYNLPHLRLTDMLTLSQQ
jgi:hypothetical protein